MKLFFIALILTCALSAETKQETELKKKLADAEAELAAQKAQTRALQSVQAGAQKLAEAAKEAAEKNGEKADELSGKVAAVEATVKAGTKITENAAKKLTATVEAQNAHVTSAINAQIEQQKRALAQAQEAARRLEIRNKITEQRAADTLRNQQESIREIASLKQVILQKDHKAEVAAAKDQTAIAHDKYAFYNSLAVPLCGVLGTLLLILQVKFAGKQKEMASVQKEIHGNTNGALSDAKAGREKAEAENRALKAEMERLMEPPNSRNTP